MPHINDPLLIVTDLDGSLLDHHTYSWQPAADWLALLRQNTIPVVICSSKTAAEIQVLQKSLALEGLPFIAENGAVLHLDVQPHSDSPTLSSQVLGKDYSTIRQAMEQLRSLKGYKFFGFGDVSEKEIIEWTGLSASDALLAKQREASEAFIWRDTDERLAKFTTDLALDDLTITQGGRFYHVMSAGSGKGPAIKWLLDKYRQLDGREWKTIGLGDGPNDVSMLEAVDYAVIIRGYSNIPVELSPLQHYVYRTQSYGPEGWSEGLSHFITSV